MWWRRWRMSDVVRVVVADDQQVVREGLVALLGLIDGVEVVGAAAHGGEAVELVGHGDVDVVLMDLKMPVLDGVRATARLSAEYPEVAVLVLTTYADDASIAQGLSNPEIAALLFIGEATVKTHINNTFAKIGARHRAEAVRYAYRHGIAEA